MRKTGPFAYLSASNRHLYFVGHVLLPDSSLLFRPSLFLNCLFHDSFKELSEITINGVCLVWGAYIGEVFRRNFGGEWSLEDVMGEKDVITYKINDIRIFPVSKVYKRLTNGSGDDVQFYFQVFKAKIKDYGIKKSMISFYLIGPMSN